MTARKFSEDSEIAFCLSTNDFSTMGIRYVYWTSTLTRGPETSLKLC